MMAKWVEPKMTNGLDWVGGSSNLGVEERYAPLLAVFALAMEQASSGKGAERHGQNKPFDRQPMMEISRMIGGPAGCFYQAMKKTQEASRMEPGAAKREILGAINYLAGAYLLLDESGGV